MTIREVFPYLRVNGADNAMAFYQKAFDAKEKFRLVEPSGRVGHLEMLLGETTVMLSDEYPELGCVGPKTIGGTSMTIHLHVDNADQMIQRAVQAGAELVRPAVDHFYGERSGTVRDPFGHEWNIGHHLEEVSPQEMQRRYNEVMKA
jgi:PhnB protein